MHFAADQLLRLLGMAAVLSSVMSFGCSGSASLPEFVDHLVPASGEVTLNGQPLNGATLVFHPEDTDSVAVTSYGSTDSAGNYEMTTVAVGHGPQAGVVKGNYLVTISKIAMQDGSPIPPDMTEADAEAEGAVEVVPPQYSQLERSSLKVEVADGHAPYNFDLKGGR